MTHIVDPDTYRAATQAVMVAIDEGDPRAAVAHANAATASERFEPMLRQLRALAFTEAGGRLADRELVERGLEGWRSLGDLTVSGVAYNVANAEQTLFEIDLGEHGFEKALIEHRDSLQTARTLYDQVGDDIDAEAGLRVQALTNAGNAFDAFSRDIEGLQRYDRAIAIDPAFGMALGNRGIALAHYADYHDHGSMLIALAGRDLDAALADRDRVLDIGGPGSLAHFQHVRAQISYRSDVPFPVRNAARWADAHGRWCFDRELFLHVSHHCLGPDDEFYDPLFVRAFTGGYGRDEQRRVDDLVDAMNVLKQEFVAARYLTWLALADDSPVREQALALSARVPFHDSLHLARWGARTGLALQALTAATNLLDKIAAFLHLYFRTGRPRQQVYFRGFWKAKARRGQPVEMEARFAEQLPKTRTEDASAGGNLGLLALCDLSRDLEGDTPLAQLLALRHAATHRFLVAHHALAPESTEWLERMEWTELVDVMLQQLAVGRAALIYLVRAVDSNEAKIVRDEQVAGKRRGQIKLRAVDADNAEID